MGSAGFKRGRQQDVVGYFYEAGEGRVVRIEELMKAFKDKYDRTQLMATMAHLCSPSMSDKYNYPIEKIAVGTWRLTTKAQSTAASQNGTITLEVLKVVGEDYLAMKDDKIYRVHFLA